MSKESRTILKTYFETGDKPTQQEFANLIESTLNYIDDGSVGFYDSALSDSTEMPEAVGGYAAGTTVADIKGGTISDVLDGLFFPTVLASIQTINSASLTGVTASTQEVGTSIIASTTATYIPGVIKNGDGTTGPNLTGDANSFSFKLPDGNVDATYPVSSNSQAHTFDPYTITFGSNIWSVTVAYDAGVGSYTDSNGDPLTNLDSQRIADSRNGNSNTITGRRYGWYGAGTTAAPTDSAGVRALSNKVFLNSSDAGSFNISIPANNKNVYFFIPSGTNVTVLYDEAFDLDVTADFVDTGIIVNDAGGTAQTYTSYVAIIPGTGYTATATYKVTIS